MKHSWEQDVYLLWNTLVAMTREGLCLRAPIGFDTDLASIPRTCLFFIVLLGVVCGVSLSSWAWLTLLFLMWGFPKSGTHNPAAVLHDWLYWELVRSGWISRREADGIFFWALVSDMCRVNPIRALIMWGSVRIGGGLYIWTVDTWNRIKGEKSETLETQQGS